MKPKTETLINAAAMTLIAVGTGELRSGNFLTGAILVISGSILEFVKYWTRAQY